MEHINDPHGPQTTDYRPQKIKEFSENLWSVVCGLWSVAGWSYVTFADRLRTSCMVPPPLSIRLRVFEIRFNNLQCFGASNAQSVRVRHLNEPRMHLVGE